MDIKEIIAALHPLERKTLPVIKETGNFDRIVEKSGLQKVEVMRALQWLQNRKAVRINQKLQEQIVLDKNGLKYREKGLPEKKFLEHVKTKTPLNDIQKKTGLSSDEINISLGILRSKNAIQISKEQDLLATITYDGKKLLEKGFIEEKLLAKDFPLIASDLNQDEKISLENLKKRICKSKHNQDNKRGAYRTWKENCRARHKRI